MQWPFWYGKTQTLTVMLKGMQKKLAAAFCPCTRLRNDL